jgi:hypothetical protein
MPTIPSLAAVFSDAAVADPGDFAAAVHQPSTGDSLEAINGQLARANVASGFQVREWMLKRGALLRAAQVGSTAPLDFFRDLYPTGDFPADAHPQSDLEMFTAIPGACINVHVDPAPTQSKAILWTWSIYWENDVVQTENGTAYPDTDCAPCLFVLDGTPKAAGVSVRRVAPSHVFKSNNRQSCFAQYWAGHYLELAPPTGHRSAGLWIAGTHKQVRVRTRAMRYIIWR